MKNICMKRKCIKTISVLKMCDGLITKKDTATSGTIIIFLEPISIVCCGVNGAVLL